MALIYVCDRCKTQFEKKYHMNTLSIQSENSVNSWSNIHIDICDACVEDVREFLKKPPKSKVPVLS